jgi:integrase/recombinase XerD
MARIMKTTPKKSTVEQIFNLYICSVTSEGVKDKTITTYKQHFHAISKRLDVSIPISTLTSNHLDKMIQRMKDEELSPRSINSYTRTLKVFFSWCNQEGYTDLNITIYKAAEAVKETYTDEELLILLEKPKADCNFCEYRNWVIVNFLLNSGCRAATVRNIQNQDVDLDQRQIVLRHTKNGKLQVIPLCRSMVTILRDYMEIRSGGRSDYLFCDEFGGFLTENALRLAIRKYNTTRGVERTSIHAFRHSFARKYLVDCGGDAFTLQKLMGHSTLKMTRHYCNIYNSDLVENHEFHSPLAQMNRSKQKTIKK